MARRATQAARMQTVCSLRESLSIRRLQPGDEEVVARLATRTPRTSLLDDHRTLFLVAFVDEKPVGFVLGYELPRRHGLESMLLIYEIDVASEHRRTGVGASLLRELERLARERGIGESFVLTEPENVAANALYASAGGERTDVVEWDFRYAGD
jgi:ribosomal protein S18 acetylase RimI-like enzyme